MMRQLVRGVFKALRIDDRLKLRKSKQLMAMYGNMDTWNFPTPDMQLQFSTANIHGKKWFYPRYANGAVHEPAVTEYFIEHIKPDWVVLDVGAHLGYFTCLAARLASKGKVHAFEVNPKTIPLLKENVRMNQLVNVVVNNNAVGSNSEDVFLPIGQAPIPGLVLESNRESGQKAAKIRLDEYVAKHNLSFDLIKIDVEGAELEVLQGMGELLAQPKLTMFVEIHPNKLEQFFKTDYLQVIQFLMDNGFQLHRIDHRKKAGDYTPIDRSTVIEKNTMVLCQKHG